MVTRRMLHGLGYRFRIHVRQLPGRPDLVFTRRRKVLQVHGCFWHRHEGCADCSTPGTRREYCLPKFARTVARDAENVRALAAAGWDVLIVWACETDNPAVLQIRLTDFLGPTASSMK